MKIQKPCKRKRGRQLRSAGLVKPRASVMRFASEMEKQLRENDHKGGWSGCDNDYLLDRLRQECEELLLAIHDLESTETVRAEAADVANFAMMISDNAA